MIEMSEQAIVEKKSIEIPFDFDPFQLEAFEAIDKGNHTLVSAPTGCGKTQVAYYLIEKKKGKKVIYTCPIKALCNEKYSDLTKKYDDIDIGLMTGDIILNPDGNLIIMTTEVLLNLINSKDVEDFCPSGIIFDEAHYLNDEGRGHVWEKCIITSVKKYDCQMVLLSATIGNTDDIIHWLNEINPHRECVNIVKTERPVPLREYVIDNTKCRNFEKKIKCDDSEVEVEYEVSNVTNDPNPEQYNLLPLNYENYNDVKKYWNELGECNYSIYYELQTLCNQINSNPILGMPAIIFVISKKKCEDLAHNIDQSYITTEERKIILNFYDKKLEKYKCCLQFGFLRRCLEKGIAYHHSGLIPNIREAVELLIKQKLIKLVFATETFAVGLNFPVKTVVITGMNKPCENGFRNFTVSEYKQMAGRAGRRFLDDYGNVIIWLYLNKNIRKVNRYPEWIEINYIINGSVDNISSQFMIEPRYVLSNIDTYGDISLKSFKLYDKKANDYCAQIPEKFVKLYDIEKNIQEYSKKGISYIDKNYNKLWKKLKENDQNEYKQMLKDIQSMSIKTEVDIFNEIQNDITHFLLYHNFIVKNDGNYSLTSKGELAINFNEINSIIFVNHYEEIFKKKEYIIPILSMFIDDGFKLRRDEIIVWEIEDIEEWEYLINNNYNEYINKVPKWTFYPKNFLIVNEWLMNPKITIDEISLNFDCDIGLIIRILIKMYQIVDELLINLVKINKTDYYEFLLENKNLLLRPPLTIESLYIN